MNTSSNYGAPASPMSLIFKIILLVGGAFIVYYSYKYFFVSQEIKLALVTSITSATVPKTYKKTEIPLIFEGGSYSVSFWLYVNNWTGVRRNYNKEVLTIANRTSANGTVTLGIYLDAVENTLHVRTSSSADCVGSPPAGTSTTETAVCLKYGVYNSMFTAASIGSMGSGGIKVGNDCVVAPFDLQKWVHVAVALNGKTTDVYLDGKLARSCVGNSTYMVDSDYTLDVAANSGFGGFYSGVVVYDFALNPEQVYREYMQGPLANVTWQDYIKSLFDPKAIGTLEYPKMN